MSSLKPRSEIPQAERWNAESVFATPQAWEAELNAVAEALPRVAEYQGKLGSSPAVLADFQHESEQLFLRMLTVYFYAAMGQAVDSNDKTALAMVGQAGALYGRTLAALAFAQPEILEIGHDTLKRWVAEEPRLAHYAHSFDDLFRQQQHVRSGEVEEVLGMVSDVFASADNIYNLLTDADLKFNAATDGKPVAQGTITKLMTDPDREVRRSAWENYADEYLAHKNTLAASLTTAVKRDVFNARVRNYNSSLEASLFANNIPVEVFHSLINTFKKNIPTWHKYWAIRRRVLGVDTLHPYDTWAPLAQSPHVSFEQAVDWICEGLRPLGEEYVSVLRRGCLEERWVDRSPNEGKGAGAFSFGTPKTHPFINMSFSDDLQGMSTLAHELGHSMHSYLTWKNQPLAYSNYTLFVAEVASNFNQAMTRAYLFNAQEDPQFQIALIEEAMYNLHRYFFQMPTLARFELEFHERIEAGKGVTADDLNGLMADLFSEGYGSEMHVDRDRVGITWATFGHLYANFYVFQYATGISAAHALAGKILDGENGAAQRYVNFLKAGSSVYPIDALKNAGVDMSTPEAVERTYAVLAQYVDRLDQLTR
jgi:oligoendopeptidase F